ncbi:putative activation/secretion signal peptide protein [Anaerovibrio sp. JC8]|uniref:ShlB/FhaC/HecB family hemolysin secretion/activation protein n=1 Tax=Anaerovibrio sp. JC8 TaxID=1240085 RepID=UPI000A0CE35D|nr:POTRA domain-containing protein [Anaerovibrio sp. JC8]ORT99723.1 putative activation/secretion signal peptide protein [Anaerovibrio sp. JC8]
MSKKFGFIGLGLSLAILPYPAVCASPLAMPDAGVISSNINKDREWRPKNDTDEVEVDINLGQQQLADNKIKVKVNEIQLSGNTIYSTQELLEHVNHFIMPQMTFEDMLKVSQAITDYYRDHGYMTTIAYLPTQNITEGNIRIDVMEGAYDEISFDNTSELVTGRAEGLTHRAKKDRVINKHELDRMLLILNDIPGVKAHGILSPGETRGEANTLFKLTTTERSGGFIYADNFGNTYTGRNRIGVLYHWNNVGHVGDQLQLGYMRSTQRNDLQNYSIKYELPILNFGTFGALEYYRTDYELGGKYRPLHAYGYSDTLRLTTRTPMKRTLDNNLYFRFNAGITRLTDRIGYWDTDSRKHLFGIRFGLDGDYRTKSYASSYKVMHTIGRLVMDTRYAMAGDVFNTEGFYQKTNFDFYHIQRLNSNLTAHFTLSGQKSWNNLDSSEKFYIAGYNGVRAFPQGEACGDDGVLGSLELRQSLGNNFQLAAFYDAGWVNVINNNPFGANSSRYLQGVGLGLIYQKSGDWYARIDHARPVGNPYSESYGHDADGIWWFQAVKKI